MTVNQAGVKRVVSAFGTFADAIEQKVPNLVTEAKRLAEQKRAQLDALGMAAAADEMTGAITRAGDAVDELVSTARTFAGLRIDSHGLSSKSTVDSAASSIDAIVSAAKTLPGKAETAINLLKTAKGIVERVLGTKGSPAVVQALDASISAVNQAKDALNTVINETGIAEEEVAGAGQR